ncbi:uncharacterized protein LOC119360942 [Triticum dicoccoides]|uniref:uncharacterized protein LOC119360942 n=1 Tax=Triticum dicoccoides TaxID=85692 RepID=UPI00188E4176|nr:uncharacterized protein LOC119360942 [Triticum dicoccoides]
MAKRPLLHLCMPSTSKQHNGYVIVKHGFLSRLLQIRWIPRRSSFPCPASASSAPHLWRAASLMHGTAGRPTTTATTHEEREHVLGIEEPERVVDATRHRHGQGMPLAPEPTVTPHAEDARQPRHGVPVGHSSATPQQHASRLTASPCRLTPLFRPSLAREDRATGLLASCCFRR